MDQNTKAWWQSTGVWGSLVAIVASVLGVAGYTLTPDDQTTIVNGVEQAVHIGLEVSSLIGAAVALWGRIRATKTIGSPAPATQAPRA